MKERLTRWCYCAGIQGQRYPFHLQFGLRSLRAKLALRHWRDPRTRKTHFAIEAYIASAKAFVDSTPGDAFFHPKRTDQAPLERAIQYAKSHKY